AVHAGLVPHARGPARDRRRRRRVHAMGAGSRRMVGRRRRNRAASATCRRRRAANRVARRVAHRLHHADGGANVQPVHLFSILMNKVLVAVFVAIISLPLAANVVGIDGADPREENRTLAAFPHLDPSWASLRAYPTNFTAWFEDHFAFRSTLVRWSAEA